MLPAPTFVVNGNGGFAHEEETNLINTWKKQCYLVCKILMFWVGGIRTQTDGSISKFIKTIDYRGTCLCKRLAATWIFRLFARLFTFSVPTVGRNNENAGQIMPHIPLPSVNSTRDVAVNDPPRKRQRIECSAFMNCVKALQPQFPVVPLDVIEQDCIRLYRREKQNLFNVIGSILGRVNLSLDMLWSNDQSVGYAVMTGQFIDYDWKLHRRILSVV
nr:zinc finger BED domain-containing protein DAYSLEEPER-like [Tanacetum cinerariifolium]